MLQMGMGPIEVIASSVYTTNPLSEKKEGEKGRLFLPNHTSFVDPPAVDYALRAMGLEPHYFGTAGLWKIPGINLIFIFGDFHKVHRGKNNAGGMVDTAVKLINQGIDVVFWPEGHIPHRDGSGDYPPVKLKTGAARVAAQTRCEVIPVGQVGARRVMSGDLLKSGTGVATAGARMWLPHRDWRVVYIGAPIKGLSRTKEDTRPDATLILTEMAAAWRVARDRRKELSKRRLSS
jgi:1-acyl-sn-glycerol-3-phosphate acyltransferase